MTACSLTVDDASRELIGVNAGDLAGYGLGWAGDPNGDGYDDLLVGAVLASGSGAAYLVEGGTSGDLDLSAAAAVLTGERASDYAGYTVGPAGDIDGDGTDDVIVSGLFNDDGGTNADKAYLVRGPVTTTGLASADMDAIGESAGDYAGSDVTGGGDVDGDGTRDVVIGAYGRSSEAGAVYLLTSFVSGSVDLSSATAIRTGETAGDRAGLNVDLAGDVDATGWRTSSWGRTTRPRHPVPPISSWVHRRVRPPSRWRTRS